MGPVLDEAGVEIKGGSEFQISWHYTRNANAMGCSSAVRILDLVAAEAKKIPSDTSIWSKSANLG